MANAIELLDSGVHSLDDFPEWVCLACGSKSIGYDPNPHNLPVIHVCLMGVGVTGEPGAERCNDCGSLDVREVPSGE